MKRRVDSNQILIDWSSPAPATHGGDLPVRKSGTPGNDGDTPSPPSFVQYLPRDFSTSFPQPSDEAIDAGILYETDRETENLKALHESYAQQCLATLQKLGQVNDARRRGVDPATGQRPRTAASRVRLEGYLKQEPMLCHRAVTSGRKSESIPTPVLASISQV